jgi:putative transcriptional regulator
LAILSYTALPLLALKNYTKNNNPWLIIYHRQSQWFMEAISCKLGVSISTLQNWEQGRREPDGPAKALLKIASKNPEAVMDALHS